MYICVKCKVLMTCTQVGRSAVWEDLVVYSGDSYKCPVCHCEMFAAAKTGYNVENALALLEKTNPIDMGPLDKKANLG